MKPEVLLGRVPQVAADFQPIDRDKQEALLATVHRPVHFLLPLIGYLHQTPGCTQISNPRLQAFPLD